MQFAAGLAFDFAQSAIPILGSGDRALLVRSRAAFEHRHGADASARVIGEFAGGTGLGNGGDRLVLTGIDGSTIRNFAYDDRAPWPAAADGVPAATIAVTIKTAIEKRTVQVME